MAGQRVGAIAVGSRESSVRHTAGQRLIAAVVDPGAVDAERLRLDMSGQPLLVLMVVNCAWLFGAFGLVHLFLSTAGA